mmetsp:Transcript_46590/g.56403  ORF Transcript_46590/g.56403 Transcript_46590/m.56403 type:complete len:84 (-) Transcript_46590:876-1127(-)
MTVPKKLVIREKVLCAPMLSRFDVGITLSVAILAVAVAAVVVVNVAAMLPLGINGVGGDGAITFWRGVTTEEAAVLWLDSSSL